MSMPKALMSWVDTSLLFRERRSVIYSLFTKNEYFILHSIAFIFIQWTSSWQKNSLDYKGHGKDALS